MTTTLVAARTAPKVTGLPKSGLILLVGDTKSGKTTLAASFPKRYVLELEHKRVDRIAFGRIDDLIERYNEHCAGLAPGEPKPIREEWVLNMFGELLQLAIEDETVETIVIDSVDEYARLISSSIAREAGVEFLGEAKKDVDSRALWGEYFERISGSADFLKECGKLVVLVAHRREAKLDKDGHITKPAGINVSGQGGDYLAKHAEIIGFMDVRSVGGKASHFLTFKGESQRAIWRSGVEELQDKEILIKKEDPFGCLLAAFGKKAETPKPQLAPARSNGKKR